MAKQKTPIPQWTNGGFIEPVKGKNTTPKNQSPYEVSLVAFVRQFATSSRRCQLLSELLAYRKLLHDAEVKTGMQWVVGSFLENVEGRNKREPSDIDVVTFFIEETQDENEDAPCAPAAINPGQYKAKAPNVHSHFINVCKDQGWVIRQATYYYGKFSHNSLLEWKGILEIDLAPEEDAQAWKHLQEKQTQIEPD